MRINNCHVFSFVCCRAIPLIRLVLVHTSWHVKNSQHSAAFSRFICADNFKIFYIVILKTRLTHLYSVWHVSTYFPSYILLYTLPLGWSNMHSFTDSFLYILPMHVCFCLENQFMGILSRQCWREFLWCGHAYVWTVGLKRQLKIMYFCHAS